MVLALLLTERGGKFGGEAAAVRALVNAAIHGDIGRMHILGECGINVSKIKVDGVRSCNRH